MKNIDIVLNDFLVQQNLHDELCACFKPNSDSYYRESMVEGVNSLVVLGGLTNERADKLFMEYCGELGLEVPVSVETMSFLHEVSHHITIPFLDEDELNESEFIKLTLCITEDESDEAYMEYFKCPIEYEATNDAVKFCNACPEVVKKLDKDILEALYGNEVKQND